LAPCHASILNYITETVWLRIQEHNLLFFVLWVPLILLACLLQGPWWTLVLACLLGGIWVHMRRKKKSPRNCHWNIAETPPHCPNLQFLLPRATAVCGAWKHQPSLPVVL
jgi:hypothetical protein